MSERYATSVIDLFRGLEAKEHYSKYGKTVEITRGSVTFVGFLVEKSIVIPTHVGKGTDELISLFVITNLTAIGPDRNEPSQRAICSLLDLRYNGQILGLYSDGQNFGQISGLHLHPKPHVETQQDFINLAMRSLASVGSQLTILE